jgi:hypothetical protein
MAGIIIGLCLVAIGLAILAHSSYINLSEKAGLEDTEKATMVKEGQPIPNDCIIPFCFFQLANVKTHETWVVAFLLSGALVLSLSLSD